MIKLKKIADRCSMTIPNKDESTSEKKQWNPV